MDDEDDVIIIDDGEPEDVGVETTTPVDEETVPDIHDEGDRPDVDWDEEGVEDDADAQQAFTSQPTPPYRAGDTWDSSGTLYVCVNGKAEGQAFSADDWVPAVVPGTAPAETQRTVTIVETITDFSAESIASYQSRGATAYAIYDDGTRVQVAWSAVREPEPTAPETVADEALIIAQATNQHFWHRSSDPDQDGAGTGAFVTDEEQETFLQAIAQGVEPTQQRPLHNLLMNAEGILLRAAKKIRAAFTPSGVAFYDGEGNNASNIVASFGSSGAVVGKSTDKRIATTSSAVSVLDADGTAHATFSTNLTVGRTSAYNTLITAAAIYLRNATNYLLRAAGSTVYFYDGAGNASANIAAQIGSAGARIGKTAEPHMVIDSTSMKLYEAGTAASNVVASFGSDGATIGKTADSHVTLDYHSMQLVDKAGNVFLNVNDLRGTDGRAEVSEELPVNFSDTTYGKITLTLAAASVSSVIYLDTTSLEYSLQSDNKTIYLTGDPLILPSGANVTVTYMTSSSLAKAYTAGLRSSGAVGPMSFAEGNGVIASAFASHAEGGSTTASGRYSHAEGYDTSSKAQCSHTEGYGAEARGYCSHAEGYDTTVVGSYSHTQGRGTVANGDYQTVIGRFNSPTGAGLSDLLIVGNGSSNSSRSNALTVDWDGNVKAGGYTATGAAIRTKSPTIDRDGADPSETLYSPVLGFLDKDGESIGYLQVSRGTTGTDTLNLYAVNEVNGEPVYNRISIIVRKDGTLGYSVSDQSAFLSALGLAVVSSSPTISNATVEHFKVKRQGSTVNLQVTGLKVSSALANGLSVALGTVIPSGYRPEVAVYAPIALNNANYATGLFLYITASGNVHLYNRTGISLNTSTPVNCNATWIV